MKKKKKKKNTKNTRNAMNYINSGLKRNASLVKNVPEVKDFDHDYQGRRNFWIFNEILNISKYWKQTFSW